MIRKVSMALVFVISQTVCAAAGDWKRVDTIPSDVKSVLTSTPVYNQVVVFGLPKGWKVASKNATPAGYSMEFIPADQDVQRWSDMITLQGFPNLAQNPRATPEAFLSVMAGHAKSMCGENAVFQKLGDRKVDSMDASTAIIGCSKFAAPTAFGAQAGQGEIAYYIAVKGTNDFYLLCRAMRGDEFDKGKPPISAAKGEEILKSLQPIKFCDKSEPQANCWDRPVR